MLNSDLILSDKSLEYLFAYLDNDVDYLEDTSCDFFISECLKKFPNTEQIVYRTLRRKVNPQLPLKITTLSSNLMSCSEYEPASIYAACSVITCPDDPESSYPNITVLKIKSKPLLTFTQLLENVRHGVLKYNQSYSLKSHTLFRTIKEQEVICLPDNFKLLDCNPNYTRSYAYKISNLYAKTYLSVFSSFLKNTDDDY